MADQIRLLPDHIANQIAAGEVIQRPGSAVKELLENAVDAGATRIELLIEDAGKQLIQVTDNGKGMSELDARMAFERHATSKITSIDDLFRIKTMGFRGEALASIAAVAQVILKTKRPEDSAGTLIEIENSEVVKQEPVASPDGTSIAMKNLFFNVPARRNFLKSNASEMRHILDEFTRVSMANPHLFFSLTANGERQFHLDPGTMKQRIIQLLGNQYQTKLVNVEESTDYLQIAGFIGKPETAKKTRGDQFLFVNNRFIKSPYLHHAISTAFKELIPADSHPAYALFLTLDPAQIDINVHPTKQEIKFEDEKIIYAFVQAAVKHGLAQFNIAPSLDFELHAGIQQLDAVSKPVTEQQKAAASSSSLYQSFTDKYAAHKIDPSSRGKLTNWQSFFETAQMQNHPSSTASSLPLSETLMNSESSHALPTTFLQVFATFIVADFGEMLRLFHQQYAHETILYHQLKKTFRSGKSIAQQSLFPITLHLSPADSTLLTELLPDLQPLGYLIESFGNNSFIVRGTPPDISDENISGDIEWLLEQFKHYQPEVSLPREEKLIRALARQRSIKAGQLLSAEELQFMVTELMQCESYRTTPGGQPTFIDIRKEELFSRFGLRR
ncbi:MAG: DNA mismatch repair endonuclease MutL [Bacteroidetes bacterium]|nr:DNA mismatch repair endonuclease MutL [Bacteroidota bacterium]